MGYAEDIRLENKFLKTIKSILGNYFIGQSVEMDQKQATDFAIFIVNPFTVGVRLRTYKYYLRYPNEFTIRWIRPSGVLTEIDKIRNGLVDYILYGFVDEKEQRLVKYFIGDLQVFRDCEPKPVCIKWNTPPDSALAAFSIFDLPSEFLLHTWEMDNGMD